MTEPLAPQPARGLTRRTALLRGLAVASATASAALVACGGDTPAPAKPTTGPAVGPAPTVAAVATTAPAPTAPPRPTARANPVTVRFMSWRPNAMDRFEKRWKEWGDANRVVIEIERIPNANDRNTKIVAGFAADQAPDVTDSHSDVEYKYYESGFIMQLDQLMARDKISQDKGYAMTYAERWRSKTFALAYWVEPFGIYYNKTMFKKKGIADPWEKKDKPGEWTLEEMLDACRKATNRAEDEWGMDWGYGYHDIGPFIWSQGETHYDYETMKWQLENPASVTAHGWMLDWRMKSKWNIAGPEKTRMMEPWGQRALDNNGMTPFANGKVAVHYRSVNDWSRMWPVVKDQFEWDMLPMPSVNGKPGASWTAGHPVDAWSKTKNPDAVWDFLKFLIGDDFQTFLSQEQVLVPAKLDAQAKFFRAPSVQPTQHATVFSEVFKRPHGITWRHFKGGENANVYGAEVAKIYDGAVPLAQGLKDLSARLQLDVDWGGGDPPFKGLKLPIRPG